MCKINLCSYLGTYRLFPCFWFCLTEIWVCIRLSDCRLAFKSKRFDKPWIRKNTKTRKRRNKASNKFLNFRARKPDVGGGERSRGRVCVCRIHGNERENSLRFSRVVLRQTSSAKGREKKEGCAVTHPFFFSPQPVRDSSKVQRNERKGAWPRVHRTVPGGSLLRFLVSPSVSPS